MGSFLKKKGFRDLGCSGFRVRGLGFRVAFKKARYVQQWPVGLSLGFCTFFSNSWSPGGVYRFAFRVATVEVLDTVEEDPSA